MNNPARVLALVACTGLLNSCSDLGQQMDQKVDMLLKRTESLDSLVNKEFDKVRSLDSLINAEGDKIKQLDSLIDRSTSKIDSIASSKLGS
jgi:hypothetical protein